MGKKKKLAAHSRVEAVPVYHLRLATVDQGTVRRCVHADATATRRIEAFRLTEHNRWASPLVPGTTDSSGVVRVGT